MTNRSALRRTLRQQRKSVPPAVRIAAANHLAQRLFALPFAPDHGAVAGYWATDGEIPLHAWQMQLPTHVQYCLPLLMEDTLRFAAWKPGQTLKTNIFGIPEPDVPFSATLPAEAMALIVMPLVGFDSAGHRLGMGGGWYDRTLTCRQNGQPPPWLVGAGFALQQVPFIQPEPWDIPYDALCTEHATFLVHH